MIKHSDDRRSRRSRNMMKQGLLELMREKPFPTITAREVTDRMDLNRSTFYLHYPDVSSLLNSIEDDMLSDAQRMIDERQSDIVSASLEPLFRTVLDYIAENREVIHILIVNDSSRFMDRMQELISRNGATVLHARFPKALEEMHRYLLSFIAYGLIGLIQEWIRSDMSIERESLVKDAERMVLGASEYLLR